MPAVRPKDGDLTRIALDTRYGRRLAAVDRELPLGNTIALLAISLQVGEHLVAVHYGEVTGWGADVIRPDELGTYLDESTFQKVRLYAVRHQSLDEA